MRLQRPLAKSGLLRSPPWKRRPLLDRGFAGQEKAREGVRRGKSLAGGGFRRRQQRQSWVSKKSQAESSSL